jgi:hypothetical protein
MVSVSTSNFIKKTFATSKQCEEQQLATTLVASSLEITTKQFKTNEKIVESLSGE